MNSPLRADARSRRAALLDAADSVFSEHGITAPLDLVVERAGVGRATLYRNFPDRTALLQAMLERTADTIAAHVAELGQRDDALFELLAAMAKRIINSPALADYWRAVDPNDPQIAAVRQRILGLMQPALERAIGAGLCRADLRPSDISLYASMLGAALRGHDRQQRQELAERALQLLGPGLRAGTP